MAHVRLAFSPDSDDIFMFWPLLHKQVPWGEHTFEHVRADTQALNELAEREGADVVAVSIATYPRIRDRYLLLPHGGSVGRGYGPALVSKRALSLGELGGRKVGVPGLGTTAFLVLRAIAPDFEPVVLPISPYRRVFDALDAGEVEAALVIHEGRLHVADRGLHEIADLGKAWAAHTGGLPLPLGGNAIRRGLGAETIADVSAKLRASVAWALEHRGRLIDELLSAETRGDVALDRARLDRYLAMYANDDTLGYPPDAREACQRLVDEGARLGVFAHGGAIEWAP
jgi:1,4-dihydroxy-6-naphthoate synthase